MTLSLSFQLEDSSPWPQGPSSCGACTLCGRHSPVLPPLLELGKFPACGFGPAKPCNCQRFAPSSGFQIPRPKVPRASAPCLQVLCFSSYSTPEQLTQGYKCRLRQSKAQTLLPASASFRLPSAPSHIGFQRRLWGYHRAVDPSEGAPAPFCSGLYSCYRPVLLTGCSWEKWKGKGLGRVRRGGDLGGRDSRALLARICGSCFPGVHSRWYSSSKSGELPTRGAVGGRSCRTDLKIQCSAFPELCH